MAVAQTTPTPARLARRISAPGWVAAGVIALAAILAAVTIAAWPTSEADKARADGDRLGEAVAQLYNAQSSADVDAALTEIHAAAGDTRDHAGDRVADQVADQEDALARAADGFAGVHTSSDAFEVDLYQAELDIAVDDLTAQASAFRADGPEVEQAFWEGFQGGLNGN